MKLKWNFFIEWYHDSSELLYRTLFFFSTFPRIWEKKNVLTQLLMYSCSVKSDSLWPYGLQPTRLLCPSDSPGKNTGVVCHALLQGIFPTQGLNLGLPYCRQALYCLSPLGSLMYREAHFSLILFSTHW